MILLSPAKKLDHTSSFPNTTLTQACCLDDSQTLVNQLKTYAPQQIAALMHLSDDLAQLNVEQFADWQLPFNLDNAKPAMFAFAGDVYASLHATKLLTFTAEGYVYNPALTQHPQQPVFTRKID